MRSCCYSTLGDDGNLQNGDGCNESCDSIEPGFICVNEPSFCGPNCGDGLILQPSEECDDGNNRNNDGCSPFCQVEVGWTCNPQGQCQPICGDGLIRGVGGETCDDGNANDGDGCSSLCQVEQDFTCVSQPSLCSFPGNGIVEALEACNLFLIHDLPILFFNISRRRRKYYIRGWLFCWMHIH